MSEAKDLSDWLIEIGKLTEPADRLQMATDAALALTGATRSMVAIIDSEVGQLSIRYGSGGDFLDDVKNEPFFVEPGQFQGIVGHVAVTGKTFKTDDVGQEPLYRKLFSDTVSELAVPILDPSGRLQAVLNLESNAPNTFDSGTRKVATALAVVMGNILKSASERTRVNALLELGSTLSRALTEEALVDLVVHVASEILQFQAASIFLLDEKTDSFVLRGSTSRLKTQLGEIQYRRDEGLTGWVCNHAVPVLLQKPQDDPRWRGRFVEFPSDEIASFLCVPIVVRGQSTGAIRVLRRRSANPLLETGFALEDLELLEAIALQVGAGLDNIRIVERLIRSERMIAWGELSAKSSHMIGNRVFALRGDVNELKYLLSEPEPKRKPLIELQASLVTNLDRVEEILQDFRDFVIATRIERSAGSITDLIRETAREVFPKESQVRLFLDLNESLPPVSMDATKLRRALSELIENALNYTELTKSEPSVRIACDFASEMDESGRGWISIVIEDSGPGIPEELKGQIFEPFFSGRVKGMGLGLSIVKGIVDAHGGQIRETGRPGEGARFEIRIPALIRP